SHAGLVRLSPLYYTCAVRIFCRRGRWLFGASCPRNRLMMFRRSPRAAVLSLLAVAALFATGLVAQGGPRAEDATTAKLVAEMVRKFHISQQGLNEEISAKTFEKYLTDLDPLKLYFLQKD